MDISRLDYLIPLDVDIISDNFMRIYIEMHEEKPTPEELVAWTTTNMGELAWKDPEHYMYDWLIKQAERAIDDYFEED